MQSLLPLLLILVCPLMMVFMMRGMHKHGSHPNQETTTPRGGIVQVSDESDVDALREQRDSLEARVEELEAQMRQLGRDRLRTLA